jgi:hypothetical protein
MEEETSMRQSFYDKKRTKVRTSIKERSPTTRSEKNSMRRNNYY